jgi:hypothetical protein
MRQTHYTFVSTIFCRRIEVLVNVIQIRYFVPKQMDLLAARSRDV